MMEENAQLSLLPDAVGATQMTMTGEEEIDLSEYRKGRFLPQIRKPCGDPYASRGRVHRAERRIIRSNGRTMWLSGNKGDD